MNCQYPQSRDEPLGVRNVVTTFEREVVLESAQSNNSLKSTSGIVEAIDIRA